MKNRETKFCLLIIIASYMIMDNKNKNIGKAGDAVRAWRVAYIPSSPICFSTNFSDSSFVSSISRTVLWAKQKITPSP